MVIQVLDEGVKNPIDILNLCCLWIEGAYI